MKEKLTLRNVLVWLAAILGIAAFFVAFGAGIKASEEVAGIVVESEMKGLIMGKQVIIAAGLEVEAPAEEVVRATLSLVGVILMLVAAVALVASTFLDEKVGKIVRIAAVVMIVVGVVFVFCLKDSYINSGVEKDFKEMKDAGMEVTAEDKKAAIEQAQEMFKDYKLNGGALVTAILGIVSALAAAASFVVPEKKLVK